MKLSFRYISFILCLFFCSNIFCQSDTEALLKNEINKIIRYEVDIDFKKTPGFIVAVLDQDTSFYVSFGTQIGSNTSIRKSDLFEIGSCSKSLTAEIIFNLVHRNLIDINASINNYLPENLKVDPFQNLTVLDLLIHRTNFPKRPSGIGLREDDSSDPYANYTLNDFQKYIQEISDEVLTDNCSYSHINYALLGQIILSIEPENTLSKHEVEELVPGTNRSGKEAYPWNANLFNYSEGARSNATELIKLIHLMTRVDTARQNFYSSARCKSIFNNHFFTAPGWTIVEGEADFDIFAMTGATDRHAAFMAFIKETKTGVVVLSNSANGTSDLGMAVLRMVNNNWKRKS